MSKILAWLALLAFTSAASAAPRDALEQAIEMRLEGSGTPGLGVAVVEPDGSITQMSFGKRDVEHGSPVTAETLFRNGSASKMWVAAALIQALRQRGISLRAPIGSFVPNLPPPLRRLTVHQLLTHTSGLADAAEDFGPPDEAALARRMLEGKPLFFAPQDAVFSYSNPGYDLAGYVLEVISGRPFADAMDALVLKPAGMDKSFYRPDRVAGQPLALGHVAGAGKALAVARPMPDNASERPSGLAFTTALDSAKFARLLMRQSDPPLDRSTVTAMTHPHVVLSDGPAGWAYGYGLLVSKGARLIWQHGGSITGYTASTTILPQEGIAVVLLANGAAAPLLREVTDLILAHLGFEPIPRDGPVTGAPSPSFDPVEPSLAASLTGDWGQGTAQVTIRPSAGGPEVVRGGKAAGILRSAGTNRLALINPEGRFGGYWYISHGSTGEVMFLRSGNRALTKIGAADPSQNVK